MQQNTWRHQTFCYMIQHYNAHFKIVRLQKSKTSIKKKKIPKNFSDPIKKIPNPQKQEQLLLKKNVRCQK
jgi:hypothetical protein